MRIWGTVGALSAAAIVMATLSGCSSDDPGGSQGQSGGHGGPAKADLATVAAPSGYDTRRGWDASLDWLPGKVATNPFTPVGGDRLALLDKTGDAYSVAVHVADTGTVKWSSKPWTPPAAVDGAEGDETEPAEIPGVQTVHQDGRDYVVTWAHGMEGKDTLHEGREVVQLAVYEAYADGSNVNPTRKVSIPVTTLQPNEVYVNPSPSGLVVSWGGPGPFGESGALADMATGKVSEFDSAELPGCGKSYQGCDTGVYASAAGNKPLVALTGGGFGVPGQWTSEDHAPAKIPARNGVDQALNGQVRKVFGSRIVAVWRDPSGLGGWVWAVHNLQNQGVIEAQVACDVDEYDEGYTGQSANGRYLVTGPVAFDLKTNEGTCLAGDGNRKEIQLASVADDGTAYGATPADMDHAAAPARVQLDSGKASALPEGTLAPALHVGRSGLFVTTDDNSETMLAVRALK